MMHEFRIVQLRQIDEKSQKDVGDQKKLQQIA